MNNDEISAALGAPSDPEDAKPVTLADKVAAEWPRKGGFEDGAQPWQATRMGFVLTGIEPGKRAENMPVVPDHDKPILTSGYGGPAVTELGRLLGELGYGNSVTEGVNPFEIMDQSMMEAVEAFRRDYDVLEDPTAFGGDNPVGRDQAANHVGTWTWTAVLRAAAALQVA